jgi:site-specific DNA-methyltransferase (cytosine-N4-specific)
MTTQEQCTGMRNKRDVWHVATAQFPEAHFAVFPEELIYPCILAGSEPKDIILDPFLGSGTTWLSANKLGRNYIGIELNPEYAKMAEDRIKGYTGVFIPEKTLNINQ